MSHQMKILYVLVIASVILSAVSAFASFNAGPARVQRVAMVPGLTRTPTNKLNCTAFATLISKTQEKMKPFQDKMAPAKAGGVPKKLTATDQKDYNTLIKEVADLQRLQSECLAINKTTVPAAKIPATKK